MHVRCLPQQQSHGRMNDAKLSVDEALLLNVRRLQLARWSFKKGTTVPLEALCMKPSHASTSLSQIGPCAAAFSERQESTSHRASGGAHAAAALMNRQRGRAYDNHL